MKNSFVFLLLMSLSSVAFSAVKVEYRISRIQGLFNFVQAVTGQPHQSPGLREVFEKSEYNKSDLQNQIAIYKTLQRYLDRPTLVDNETQIPGRYPARPVSDLILIQSVFAKDLVDLSQRTSGYMSLKVQDQFMTVLKKFEPAYNELVWNKSLTELQKHKEALEKMALEVNIDSLFAKAALFYRANWPADLPFTVGLYPIPWIEGGFKNSSNSHSVGTVEDHGVMIGMKSPDLKNSFAVIFHEMCHSLYDSQSADYMKTLSSYFTESPSLYSSNAYKWFNEAVATSIGNGWVYSVVNKAELNGIWYADNGIDGYAKAIYALTKEYLTLGKTLDRNYVDQSIALYAKKFPEAIYLYQDQFLHISFVHDGSFLKNSEVRELIQSRFFLSGYSATSPLNHPVTIQSVNGDRNTVVIAFNAAEAKPFEQLVAGVPFLKKNMVSLLSMKNRSFFSALDEKARPYIVIRAETKQDFIAAIDRMKSLRRIDPQMPIQNF